jgi:hypothetical protein
LKKQIAKLEKQMFDCNWENPEVYANFLAQTYYYVCHSTRLLGLCTSFFQVDRDQLHRRFSGHMGEEKSHERLALHDLKELGFTLKDTPELSQTRAFYESQYYKIERQDATALFGYILLLEALSVKVGPPIYERVCIAHGKKTASFLRVHVEEDPDHVEKALEQIHTLPPAQLEFIRINMIQTAEIYGNLISAMAHGLSHRNKAAA